MRLLIINPNSTEEMTASMVAVARRADPDLEILGWTNTDGPPAIEGAEDGAAAVPGLRALLPRARAEGVDAIVIGCFDDTGLAEMQAGAHCPVIGIGQAAYATARLLGHRFSVLTSLAVSIPVLAANIRAQGHADACASVRASGLPVLVIKDGSEETRAHLAAQIRATRQEDGATAVILGCAGMASMREDLAARSRLPLLDGVICAARLAPALARLTA